MLDTLNTLRCPLYARTLRIITYFQIHSIMQNKPNLGNDKMSINLYTTKDYEKNADFRHGKTKPKQTQFKANKAKNKPNLTQNKPNSKPIQKMNAFAWIRSFTVVFCGFLTEFITLKGTNFIFYCRKTPQSRTIYREHGNLIIL